MRVLLIGPLSGEIGQAGRIAISKGAKLTQADDVAGGLAALRGGGGVDLVLCDVRQDVAALVRSMAAERIATPVVACGIGNDVEAAVRAIKAGAREFLPLPPDPDLIAAILAAVSGESHAMIARDPAMRATIGRADQVAASEASILLVGESGSGKEVMARHIHRRSRRAGGPFVAVNCAALPETMLESELFGHEKGAFTGAVARRVGKFEAAHGGTLLLDEVSEMDVRLQAKLLRAIQEKEIDRLGGGAPVKVDVRLIATTNRDLSAEVRAGRFREDLYFRLNVVALRLPALRERPADIAPLAEHFARKYAEVNGLAYRPLAPAALVRLAAHHWPGNVRELENTLHRAVLLAAGETIGAEAIELGPLPVPAEPDLPPLPHHLAARGAAGADPRSPAAPGDVGVLVGRTVADVERDLILHTLGHCLGNRTHAATILGISIRTLRNRLRDYAASGLAVPPPREPGAREPAPPAAGHPASGLPAEAPAAMHPPHLLVPALAEGA